MALHVRADDIMTVDSNVSKFAFLHILENLSPSIDFTVLWCFLSSFCISSTILSSSEVHSVVMTRASSSDRQGKMGNQNKILCNSCCWASDPWSFAFFFYEIRWVLPPSKAASWNILSRAKGDATPLKWGNLILIACYNQVIEAFPQSCPAHTSYHLDQNQCTVGLFDCAMIQLDVDKAMSS